MRRCPSCKAELGPDTAFCTGCGMRVGDVGADPPPAPDDGTLAPGQVVDGKYAVERVLGEGGMGVVYLARSLHTDIEVVIKAVRPEIAHRKDVRDRTLAEGKALARIDHPNVVQLKSVVVSDRQLLLVMQYIQGDNLEEVIHRHVTAGQFMPWAEALPLFRQVLAGVGAAHAEGVIHRDLKPANMLIRAKVRVAMVTDFGFAKPEQDAQEGKGETKGIIGSVHYMSPEQVKGQRDLDRRVDTYALGIVLFQMITGRVPFDADNAYDLMRKQIEAPMPSIGVHRSDLPAGLDGLLQRACAKDREHRFSSCDAFLVALDGLSTATAALGMNNPMATGATVPGSLDVVPPAAGMPVKTVMGTPAAPHAPVPHTPLAHGTITGQAAELPATVREPGTSWLVPVLAIVGVMVVVGGGLFAGGVFDSHGGDGGSEPDTTTTSESTTTSSEEDQSLDLYAGTWVSESGRKLEAVIVADKLEFRVVDPADFTPQPYAKDEVRFVLHPLPEPGNFLVEDRVRPVPPAGHGYASAMARATCVAVWREAGGESLKARASDDRLDVEFAKIEPSSANFAISGRQVVSCKGLERLAAVRLPAVLRRP